MLPFLLYKTFGVASQPPQHKRVDFIVTLELIASKLILAPRYTPLLLRDLVLLMLECSSSLRGCICDTDSGWLFCF
jgi:hypothetical protein